MTPIYILALAPTPNESPLNLLNQLLTKGFPATFPFLALFSSLLFLSTVLASVVGMIYFLVLPEMKNYYSTGTNGKENTLMVWRTLKPDERTAVNGLDAHGGTYYKSTSRKIRPATIEDPQSRSGTIRAGNRSCGKAREHEPGFTREMTARRNAPVTGPL